MYRTSSKIPRKTSIKVNNSYKGETIEQKINRIVNNKEPIKDGAPIVYTERKDGVKPKYDIRTDRWEIAVEGMDHVSKAHLAKREERLKKSPSDKEKNKSDTGGDGEAKPI